MDLTLGVDDAAGRAVLTVAGDVDVDTAPALRYAVHDLLEQGHRDLVVNVSGVEFIDSTGLGVLVGMLREARSRKGTLELVCTQARMLKLLHLTGLDEAFTVHDGDIAGTG